MAEQVGVTIDLDPQGGLQMGYHGDTVRYPIMSPEKTNEYLLAEVTRLRDALKLAQLRMKGVAIKEKNRGDLPAAAVVQRWTDDISEALQHSG